MRSCRRTMAGLKGTTISSFIRGSTGEMLTVARRGGRLWDASSQPVCCETRAPIMQDGGGGRCTGSRMRERGGITSSKATNPACFIAYQICADHEKGPAPRCCEGSVPSSARNAAVTRTRSGLAAPWCMHLSRRRATAGQVPSRNHSCGEPSAAWCDDRDRLEGTLRSDCWSINAARRLEHSARGRNPFIALCDVSTLGSYMSRLHIPTPLRLQLVAFTLSANRVAEGARRARSVPVDEGLNSPLGQRTNFRWLSVFAISRVIFHFRSTALSTLAMNSRKIAGADRNADVFAGSQDLGCTATSVVCSSRSTASEGSFGVPVL
ncbi:hypothetical protein PSPO01_02853 [Paraphaeosphaeria sporulosa]